jgi:hypothetical protein
MRQQLTIASISEFQQHEPDMLAVINGAPHGADLFIADPFRFLNEHGYTVTPALQAQMERAAPALAKMPKHLYDGIAARRTSLAGALQAQMESAAPTLAKTPTQLHDGIAARRTSLAVDSTLDITWHIRSLGVKL